MFYFFWLESKVMLDSPNSLRKTQVNDILTNTGCQNLCVQHFSYNVFNYLMKIEKQNLCLQNRDSLCVYSAPVWSDPWTCLLV